MEELKRAIERELNKKVSKETIQKDIAKMKSPLEEGGYEAPIKFKKSVNGYYYDLEAKPDFTIRKYGLNEKSLQQIELAAGFLNRFKGIMSSDSFNQTLNHLYASLNIERSAKEKNLVNAILPKDTTYLRGMENFELLVEGIKLKTPLSIVHYSYQSELFKSIIVHPYLLKESNERWYLVGYSEEHKEIRYFGVDRIYEPVMIEKPYIENTKVDLKSLFANRIGLSTLSHSKENKVETIKLWFSKDLANYFKSMPIHRSQHISEFDGNGDIIVTLELVPTMELIAMILSYGTKAEILEPKWLRKKIETELSKTHAIYNDKNKLG